MTAFATEHSGFADSVYGPIDPVVAASATGKAPGGFRVNTDTGQNVTRQTVENATTKNLWDLRDGILPWLLIVAIAFVLIQTKLNK